MECDDEAPKGHPSQESAGHRPPAPSTAEPRSQPLVPNRGRPQPRVGGKPPDKSEAAGSVSLGATLSRRHGEERDSKITQEKSLQVGGIPRPLLSGDSEPRFSDKNAMGTNIGPKGTAKGAVGGSEKVSERVHGLGGHQKSDSGDEESMEVRPGFFPSFCSNKERKRKVQTCPQSKNPQRVSEKEALPLRLSPRRQENRGAGALRMHHRFGTSVPPYPCKFSRPEKTLFFGGRGDFHMGRPPLRTQDSALLFHPHDKTAEKGAQQGGDRPLDLPGRLVDCRQDEGRGSQENGARTPNYQGVRLPGELEEERPDSSQDNQIPRTFHKFSEVEVFSAQEKAEENQIRDQQDTEVLPDFLESTEGPARLPGSGHTGREGLQALDEGYPTRTQTRGSPKSRGQDPSVQQNESRFYADSEAHATGVQDGEHQTAVLQLPDRKSVV